MFNKKAQSILENYGSIKTVTRLFYPRNFNLSDEFINAFRKEYARLKSLGIDDKRILLKLNKALHFHTRETNKA
ncbi:MAG: hypothetical protein EBU90_03305 [Proteobacteria bacterium]|nr:hypothetical protein [Pseudomonadota bacterium]NBP13354.1 hypothetical protein [bacterium]